MDTSNNSQRFDLFCEYCGYRNHKKDNCYRLVGYPPGFQSKKRENYNDGSVQFRPNGGNQGDGFNSFGNNQNRGSGYRPQSQMQHNSGGYRSPRPAGRGDSSGTRPKANTSHKAEAKTSSSQGHFFSDQQYDEIRQMLGKGGTPEYSLNLAGITALLFTALEHEWITDTGATHHITPFKELLTSLKAV